MLSSTFKRLSRHLYYIFFAPQSLGDDNRRREFMLNVLLCGLSILAILKLIYSLIYPQHLGFDQEEDSLAFGILAVVLPLMLWRLSRRGYYHLAASCLIGLLTIEAVRLTMRWSFELPVTELTYALTVVVTGVLMSSRWALSASFLIGLTLLTISYDQITDHLQPRTDWLQQTFQMTDAVGYVAVLLIIALVSWLTNRDISQSFSRAHASEAALIQERDTLEVKVRQRTQELQEAIALRTRELQRFAEFGRLSASLLHEVANPLTAASLYLQQTDIDASEQLIKARRSLHQLERYVEAARKQLKSSSFSTIFSVKQELRLVDQVMRPLAHQKHIKLTFRQDASHKLYGDPVKFNQLVANLIANSIDAYTESVDQVQPRHVEVSVSKHNDQIEICVSDWGKGVPPHELEHLFEPFYTTKPASDRSMGIGLAMIKQVVEQDFGGRISVTSSPESGTTFVIVLPFQPSKRDVQSKPKAQAP